MRLKGVPQLPLEAKKHGEVDISGNLEEVPLLDGTPTRLSLSSSKLVLPAQ